MVVLTLEHTSLDVKLTMVFLYLGIPVSSGNSSYMDFSKYSVSKIIVLISVNMIRNSDGAFLLFPPPFFLVEMGRNLVLISNLESNICIHEVDFQLCVLLQKTNSERHLDKGQTFGGKMGPNAKRTESLDAQVE